MMSRVLIRTPDTKINLFSRFRLPNRCLLLVPSFRRMLNLSLFAVVRCYAEALKKTLMRSRLTSPGDPGCHRSALRFTVINSLILVMSCSVSAIEFRSLDGAGNHLVNLLQGAAGTRVIRFGYDADYPDGIGDVIAAASQPNPRDVSNRVLSQAGNQPSARGLSDWSVLWGQFLTHDLTLIETGGQYNVLSTGVTGDFSIPITDPADPLGPGPIAFNRSAFDPQSGNGELQVTPRGIIPVPRWQLNSNTSYLDASQIYGSSENVSRSLRTLAGGKLTTSSGGLLPLTNAAGRFVAGDNRANENVGLTSLHALFVREHNRLTDRLHVVDSSLTDEELYQWARKIVGAELQSITYREYLPAVMGADAAPRAEDFAYDEGDASITTAFSAAAFRFGHSMQSAALQLVDASGASVGAVGLGQATENPAYLTGDPQRVDFLLAGLASQVAQENDAAVIDALRNIRVGPPGTSGTDLAALDIQRGRDLGLLSNYRLLRQAYNLSPVHSFAELTSDPQVQANLASVYGEPGNLDAWVAMISEDHLPGSSLGALAQSILESQFKRLRDGDRLFFTGDADLQSPLVKGVINLDELTLSQVIRWNTGITRLQSNVFFAVPEPCGLGLAMGVVLTLAARFIQARYGVGDEVLGQSGKVRR
jgi:hypothetical protein